MMEFIVYVVIGIVIYLFVTALKNKKNKLEEAQLVEEAFKKIAETKDAYNWENTFPGFDSLICGIVAFPQTWKRDSANQIIISDAETHEVRFVLRIHVNRNKSSFTIPYERDLNIQENFILRKAVNEGRFERHRLEQKYGREFKPPGTHWIQ